MRGKRDREELRPEEPKAPELEAGVNCPVKETEGGTKATATKRKQYNI